MLHSLMNSSEMVVWISFIKRMTMMTSCPTWMCGFLSYGTLRNWLLDPWTGPDRKFAKLQVEWHFGILAFPSLLLSVRHACVFQHPTTTTTAPGRPRSRPRRGHRRHHHQQQHASSSSSSSSTSSSLSSKSSSSSWSSSSSSSSSSWFSILHILQRLTLLTPNLRPRRSWKVQPFCQSHRVP